MASYQNLARLLGENYVLTENNITQAIKAVTLDKSREESSFYHLNVDELVRRMKMWREALPRVEPHYAVKCNDDLSVLKTLALMGAGFDCASRAEIKKILSIGVSPSRIVYAHPCKIASHLKYARTNKVHLMTFDSQQELVKVSKLFPECELLLRIRCDATSAQCDLGVKFGVYPSEARELLHTANTLQLKVVGVAFHVGSGCAEPQVFHRAIKAAKQVFLEAEEEGHSPTILDIGGGFLGGQNDKLDDAASHINSALDDYFPKEGGVRVIAEPGRFMVASAFTLATPIINKRQMKSQYNEDIDSKSNMYFIDDGLYGSFNCMLYDHQVVKPATLERFYCNKLQPSSVWGPTCDGFDLIVKSMMLPAKLKVGDWLTWDEMGAYTFAAAGTFNGFPLPAIIPHLNYNTSVYLHELITAQAKTIGSICCSEDESSSGVDSRPSSPEY